MKKFLIILGIAVGIIGAFYPKVHAAISLVSSASSTLVSTTVTSTLTTTAVANGIIIGTGGTRSTINAPTMNGVSFNGLPFTKIIDNSSDATDKSYIWYLLNPPVGTFIVSSTYSSAAASGIGVSTWDFYSGVDQTNPIEASTSIQTTNASASTTITTITDGDYLVSVIGNKFLTTSFTIIGGGTSLGQASSTVGNVYEAAQYNGPISPAQNKNIGWTISGSVQAALSTIALKPAIIASSSSNQQLQVRSGKIQLKTGRINIKN